VAAERATNRWPVTDVNAALKRAIDKETYGSWWHRQARSCSTEYYEAMGRIRKVKVWCPAERDEERLSKFPKHPEGLSYEEHG
jgi:hypothetical protein